MEGGRCACTRLMDGWREGDAYARGSWRERETHLRLMERETHKGETHKAHGDRHTRLIEMERRAHEAHGERRAHGERDRQVCRVMVWWREAMERQMVCLLNEVTLLARESERGVSVPACFHIMEAFVLASTCMIV